MPAHRRPGTVRLRRSSKMLMRHAGRAVSQANAQPTLQRQRSVPTCLVSKMDQHCPCIRPGIANQGTILVPSQQIPTMLDPEDQMNFGVDHQSRVPHGPAVIPRHRHLVLQLAEPL
ncbi:hypothetical protein MTO96_009160 [Rhipicephalus appendiculatus]